MLILFGYLLLVFSPSIIILFSKKATGKAKTKWFLYCIASVTIAPFILIAIMGAVTGILIGKRMDLVFLEVLSVSVLGMFFGWGVLYLFNKKHKITNVANFEKV